MADRKAVVKNADMSEDMQQDAIDIATQALEKFNIEKEAVSQLFRVVVKAADEASFTHGQNKRRYKVGIMAQGSEFYVPNIFRDSIAVNAKGYSDLSTWSDLELVNTKSRWECCYEL